jgi:small subunit ribosomal protein S6
MRKYEAVVILRPESETVAEGKEFLRNLFNSDGCKTVREEEMGDRQLAYEIKKSKRGYYLLYELETQPESIPGFDKVLKLRSDVLKYLFIHPEE